MKKRARTQNFNTAVRNFWHKALKFTEMVILWVTILYILNWFTSVALIVWAIYATQNFSYLDVLITETNETFRQIVGMAIIKFGIENVFKYNDFGGKIPSRKKNETETENCEDNGGICG